MEPKSPYTFNDAKANQLGSKLGKQWGARIKKKAKTNPNPLQVKSDQRGAQAVRNANVLIAQKKKEAVQAEKAAAKATALSDKATAIKVANSAKRKAENQRLTLAHKTKMKRLEELGNLSTKIQVDRVRQIGEAKSAIKPAAKPATKSKSKPVPNVGPDNILKPLASGAKKAPKPPSVKVDEKAADRYND